MFVGNRIYFIPPPHLAPFHEYAYFKETRVASIGFRICITKTVGSCGGKYIG